VGVRGRGRGCGEVAGCCEHGDVPWAAYNAGNVWTSRGTVSFSTRILLHAVSTRSVLDSRLLEADRNFVSRGFWTVSFDF
jgi:hypothetical protein